MDAKMNERKMNRLKSSACLETPPGSPAFNYFPIACSSQMSNGVLAKLRNPIFFVYVA